MPETDRGHIIGAIIIGSGAVLAAIISATALLLNSSLTTKEISNSNQNSLVRISPSSLVTSNSTPSVQIEPTPSVSPSPSNSPSPVLNNSIAIKQSTPKPKNKKPKNQKRQNQTETERECQCYNEETGQYEICDWENCEP